MRIVNSLLNLVGDLVFSYMALVLRTRKDGTSLSDISGSIAADTPCIVAMWHGQHFLIAPALPRPARFQFLVAHNAGGTIYGRLFTRFGCAIIRGSGGEPHQMRVRGGHIALRNMVRALKGGMSVAMTADVPRRARKVGNGIVTLAKITGRPIIPVAVVTNRFITMKSWDRAALHLPFAAITAVAGAPIYIPTTSSAGELETKRKQVEDSLNTIHETAYAN